MLLTSSTETGNTTRLREKGNNGEVENERKTIKFTHLCKMEGNNTGEDMQMCQDTKSLNQRVYKANSLKVIKQ